jgi:hypothetical protein
MGRAANALDWTEEGSGVGLRALIAYPSTQPPEAEPELDPARVASEGVLPCEPARELREQTPAWTVQEDPIEELAPRLEPDSAFEFRTGTEPLSARGIARLSALADWIEAEAPSGAVVGLVRAFLRDIDDVGLAVGALVVAGEAFAGPELTSSIEALALAVGMWRTNLVEHVDDLAITDHRSFSGWASLPEYSSAYTLAIVRPALADTDAWAVAATVRGGSDLVPLVQAVHTAVARVNATLRTAILGSNEHGERDERSEREETATRPDSPLSAAAW